MSVLKHLKTLQHVSIFSNRQHNVWCVCVRTHTTRYAAASPQITFTNLKTLQL